MEIKAFAITNLRNKEHFKFHSDFDVLVKKHTATTLGIETLYAEYGSLLADESTALKLIRKSSVTDELSDADAQRDATFRGIADTISACLNHYDPAKQAAARRLQIIFDTCGNVTLKPYEEETAALILLTEDLISKSNDIETLGIDPWVEKLQQQNDAFDSLLKNRKNEEASKTQLAMKELRNKLDALYKSMVTRINALIIVNGKTTYSDFVTELNIEIESWKMLVAQRMGRNEKTSNADSDTNTNQ